MIFGLGIGAVKRPSPDDVFWYDDHRGLSDRRGAKLQGPDSGYECALAGRAPKTRVMIGVAE